MKLRKKMEKSKLPNGGYFTISGGVDMLKHGGLALYIMTREAYPDINSKLSAAEVSILSLQIVLTSNCGLLMKRLINFRP